MSGLTHVVCPECLAVNRVPTASLSKEPLCGKCQRELLDGQPHDLSTSEFDKQVTRSGLPLVVDFWAAWCGPCKMMAPAFAQAALAMKTSVVFAKVDTEAEPHLMNRFSIRSIPMLILFKDGREVARRMGAAGQKDIENWIKDQL